VTLSLPSQTLLDADQAGFEALTETARRVLGSDAIAITSSSGLQRPVVVAGEGLTREEWHALERGFLSDEPGFLAREFEGVLSADAIWEGERLGAIHALKHEAGPFEHEDLIETFASQVATAFGMRRRPPAPVSGDDTLAELDKFVLSVHRLEDLSRALRKAIGPLFGSEMTTVMVADRPRNVLQIAPGSLGADGEDVGFHEISMRDPRSSSARVFVTGQPYISNRSPEDPGVPPEYVNAFGIERLLTVPLGEVGVLHIANKPSDFTLDDLERAETLAPRIANVVELAMTLFRLRRQQQLDGILSEVAVSVASGEQVEDFLSPALEALCEATQASLVAIVCDEAPSLFARSGPRSEEIERTVLDEASRNPAMRAYVVGPETGDPGWAAFYVPVHLGPQRVGTLAAFRVRGEPFGRAERRSLVRMANLAALARAAAHYQRQRAELARLQERQRIADDLHDDVAQILFAAQLSLDAILQGDELNGEAADAIVRARGLLIRGDTAIRTVIHGLTTPPATDIGARLACAVSNVEDEFSIAIHLKVADEAAVVARNLHESIGDALVKVARESLVNVAKHAGPCQVAVALELSGRDRLLLTVADDGRGTQAVEGERTRHGLASLRRLVRGEGGNLRVSAGADGGTKVTASLPLARVEEPRAEAMRRLADATVAAR
jgi:signal transduction histidine kinase